MDLNAPSAKTSPSRRDFLHWTSAGLGGAALAALLGRDVRANATAAATAGVHAPSGVLHFPAKAKRAIHIYLCGGLSHVDSFDYKPDLYKSHGKGLQSNERPDVFFGQVGLLHQPMFDFKQRGRSGLWVSDMF